MKRLKSVRQCKTPDTSRYGQETAILVFPVLPGLFRDMAVNRSWYYTVFMRFFNLRKSYRFLLLAVVLLLSQVVSGQTTYTYFRTESGIPYFPQLSSAPAATSAGAIYFNTTDNKLYWYNGTEWIAVGSSLSMKPSAMDVAISGTMYAEGTVTGTYTYVADPAAGVAEGTSTFRWYQADDAAGTTNKAAISGATSQSYTIGSLSGKYLAFGVTPVSQIPATGNEVLSSWQYVYSGGITASVSLTSDDVLYKGEVLSPTPAFTYSGSGVSSSTCPESGSTYTWYRNSSASKTGATTISTGTGTPESYTVLATDAGQYIGLEITPNSSCNAAVTAAIDWKQVQALTPSITSVSVTGTYSDGSTTYALKNTALTASYAGYSCTPVTPSGDTGTNSTYQWYWTSDGGSSYTAVASDGTSASYTVNTSDSSYPSSGTVQLVCGITPKATNGESGTEVKSALLTVPTLAPVYASVTIGGDGYISSTGKVQNGKTITTTLGTFSSGISGLTVTAGTAVYRWVYSATGSSSDAGTSMTGLSSPQASTHAVDITAGYGYTSNTYYIGVYVTATTSNGETGSTSVFSGWKQVQTTVYAPDGTEVVDITVSVSGGTQTWMDRNLGASQKATSLTDYKAYGSLYQWCRGSDGHQLITWSSSSTASSISATQGSTIASTTTNNSNFILGTDWVSSTLSDGSLWWNGTTAGANNPCPTGYHVPTQAEFTTLSNSYSSGTAVFTVLAMPLVGYRSYSSGSILGAGSYANYWSSTASYRLYLSSSSTGINNETRAQGFSVRCIKN